MKILIQSVSIPTVFVILVMFAVLASGLSGCGFHLRGEQAYVISDELRRLQVVRGSGSVSDTLLQEVSVWLSNSADVEVVDSSKEHLPKLILSSETMERRVLAVSAVDAKVSNYILRYRVTIKLLGANGQVLMAPEVIRVQRSYNANNADVLAKKQEEESIRKTVREDAIRKILLRFSSATVG